MNRQPFNRAAIERVRKGATARDLGWDDAFYTRVCREHGMTPVPSVSATPVMAMQAMAVKIAAPPLSPAKPVDPPNPAPPKPGDVVEVDLSHRRVRRASASVELTRKQMIVVRALARVTPHEFLSIEAMAPAPDVQPSSVTNYATPIRATLRALRIHLESAKGRGRGGYRLVDARTFEPLKFHVVGESKL